MTMEDLTPEQWAYILQFQHPDKVLSRLPGVSQEAVAGLFGLDVDAYRELTTRFARAAREAADELLAEPGFADRVDRLPFAPGRTVVALGDSITDDLQSWAEILRCLLETRRAADGIQLVNAGFSGDTTTHLICRFLDVVNRQPDWIVCMVGTNDARRHGLEPTQVLVSPEETERNLLRLRRFAAAQTAARWVWMTPARVIEEQIGSHWFLGPMQLAWRNRDIEAIAHIVRAQDDPVVDLQAALGDPPAPELLLADGLHPSLAGQKAIVRALVEELARLD